MSRSRLCRKWALTVDIFLLAAPGFCLLMEGRRRLDMARITDRWLHRVDKKMQVVRDGQYDIQSQSTNRKSQVDTNSHLFINTLFLSWLVEEALGILVNSVLTSRSSEKRSVSTTVSGRESLFFSRKPSPLYSTCWANRVFLLFADTNFAVVFKSLDMPLVKHAS